MLHGRRYILALLLAAVVLATGCGSSSDDSFDVSKQAKETYAVMSDNSLLLCLTSGGVGGPTDECRAKASAAATELQKESDVWSKAIADDEIPGEYTAVAEAFKQHLESEVHLLNDESASLGSSDVVEETAELQRLTDEIGELTVSLKDLQTKLSAADIDVGIGGGGQ